MWITSMGNHGAAGVSQNAGILVVLIDSEGIHQLLGHAAEHIDDE